MRVFVCVCVCVCVRAQVCSYEPYGDLHGAQLQGTFKQRAHVCIVRYVCNCVCKFVCTSASVISVVRTLKPH